MKIDTGPKLFGERSVYFGVKFCPPPFFSEIAEKKIYHFSCFMPPFFYPFPNSFMGDNLFIHVYDLDTIVYFSTTLDGCYLFVDVSWTSLFISFYNTRWVLFILGCDLDVYFCYNSDKKHTPVTDLVLSPDSGRGAPLSPTLFCPPVQGGGAPKTTLRTLYQCQQRVSAR